MRKILAAAILDAVAMPAGTIIGAAGGAVLGRAIDRGELKCR